MIVPNYIPEPMEVPGNVTEAPYRVRVAVIRRVTLLHLASVLMIGALTQLDLPRLGFLRSLGALAVVLLALDVWRILARGKPVEAKVSSLGLPAILVLAAMAVRAGTEAGIPVWSPVAGVLAASIYTVLCGRDYSFLGCMFLAMTASSVALAAVAPLYTPTFQTASWALGLNIAYLLYHQYDLASLLSRRRVGEELGAVVDLYRDVFNFFGYIVRVIRHWRKHRIWDFVRT